MFALNGWQKRLIIIAFTSTAIFGAARLYYRLTDDIRLSNMTYEMPYHEEWEIPPLSSVDQARIDAILDQQFHYIGKGAQAYAFASDDGQYVLKFFKFKHLKPSWFLESLPSIGPIKTYKQTQTARKRRKLEGVFASYRLAYHIHKEPSGLIYIHLNPSDTLRKSVVFKDKIGLSHTVDLDKFVFVLQKKGQTTRTVIKDLLNKGDVNTAKIRINQIFDLYVSEYAKGIYDHDHGVMHNTGFVGEYPIHLDVGKLANAPEMKNMDMAKADLEKIAYKLQTWTRANFPEYANELDMSIAAKISEIFGTPWNFA